MFYIIKHFLVLLASMTNLFIPAKRYTKTYIKYPKHLICYNIEIDKTSIKSA